MSVYVVDVSVAVKWFVPEIREVQAASLLDDQNRLLAPDLIYSEFANIIWKKTYLRSELSASQGTHIINNFPNAPLQIFSSADLFSYAFDLACETGRTAYDCMYLALALAHDEALITDDERFYNSLRKHLLRFKRRVAGQLIILNESISMRVTIGQINTTNGDYQGNTERILRVIEQAKREDANLVVLPEVAVQGYTSLDWFLDKDVRARVLEPLEIIKRAARGLTVVVGTVRPNDETSGRRLFNSAAVIRDGEILGFADKTLLPEYDVFDDPRYFEPARERRLFELGSGRLGVAVCEDFWNDKTFWRERLYAHDPAQELIEMGASVLVSINASPFGKGKQHERCRMVRHRAKENNLPVVFVNLVGGNDGVIFDGASLVVNARGETILQAPAFEEFTGTVDLECGNCDTACLAGDDIDTVRRALVLGVCDYAHKNKFRQAILGLSGGIDSALVAALACEALGAENVLGVMMPSPFSSRGSIEDSESLARNLGMKVELHPITSAFDALTSELDLKRPTRGGESLAVENLQSRLRGNILMTLSNATGRLLLSTGNKSELALGYCTLYGDTNGGLAVIGDVLKTEVYTLCRHINRDAEIIPDAIINKRPSAELAPDQFDDQSLPPYDALDPILKSYFERKSSPDEIILEGHDAELVYHILNQVETPANEFKRRQLPPTLIISRHAIGIGRRRPVTHRYSRAFRPVGQPAND